mmetsp:Transcript_71750/g.215670  ORF Transcript_71750/g.215670 Transcript_71750/m.215670 type:complete len:92 (-) Transcript_71750:559-834(-)
MNSLNSAALTSGRCLEREPSRGGAATTYGTVPADQRVLLVVTTPLELVLRDAAVVFGIGLRHVPRISSSARSSIERSYASSFICFCSGFEL